MDGIESALNVPFTFSINCRSGLLSRCECSRCRSKRGEPVTEETELMARSDAVAADAEYRRSMDEFLDKINQGRTK